MTGNSNKLRGLFLAALMVLSVFAMGASFSGTVAADHGNDQPHDKTLSNGTTYWYGQTLLHSGTADQTYEVRDSNGNLVSQIQADSSGHVVIDTELTGTGDFNLTGPGITGGISFEVVEQSLRASVSPERANNAGTDTTATFTLRSNRANYQVHVTSENLDAGELDGIFPSSVGTTDDGVILNSSNKADITADFGGTAVGDYNLTFDVMDSTATATEEVRVREPLEGDVSFAETVIVNERGDRLMIGMEFSGDVNQANVTLGDSDEVNFEAHVTVTPNSDGEATLIWDTANSTDSSTGGLIGTVEDGASVSGHWVPDGVSSPVQTGEYPVSVKVPDGGDLVETDIATAIVEERSTSGVSTHTAPAGSANPIEDASSAENGNTIAVTQNVQDKLVVQIDASGLGGYVTDKSDLNPGSGNHVSLYIVENSDSVDVNEDPKFILPQNATAVEFDSTSDTYTLVFNVGEIVQEDDDIGDKYDVVFEVHEDHEVTSETETVAAQFELIRGQSSFDLQGQQLMVSAKENAMVTGTSTWAPGTQLSVQLRSSGGQSPFTQQNKSIVVSPEGTWSGTFDLADKPDGQGFQASLRHSNAGTQQEVSGQIGELEASVTFNDQTAQDAGTLVVVDSATLSQGGFIVIHNSQGDVIGVSSYLEAGSHSDVEIRLQESVTDRMTLTAMAHKDTDENRQFGFVATGGDEDGAYTSGGSAVTSDAAVGIPTATPTPDQSTPTPDQSTPTPEPTATPDQSTPTPEPTETSSENTPGFGLVVALLALMAAALLAVRRDY